jgi:hypothetical protein
VPARRAAGGAGPSICWSIVLMVMLAALKIEVIVVSPAFGQLHSAFYLGGTDGQGCTW